MFPMFHRREIHLLIYENEKHAQILWPGKSVFQYLPASVSISTEKQNH